MKSYFPLFIVIGSIVFFLVKTKDRVEIKKTIPVTGKANKRINSKTVLMLFILL